MGKLFQAPLLSAWIAMLQDLLDQSATSLPLAFSSNATWNHKDGNRKSSWNHLSGVSSDLERSEFPNRSRTRTKGIQERRILYDYCKVMRQFFSGIAKQTRANSKSFVIDEHVVKVKSKDEMKEEEEASSSGAQVVSEQSDGKSAWVLNFERFVVVSACPE